MGQQQADTHNTPVKACEGLCRAFKAGMGVVATTVHTSPEWGGSEDTPDTEQCARYRHFPVLYDLFLHTKKTTLN